MPFTTFSTMSLGCLTCNTMEGSTKSFRIEDEMETRSFSVRLEDDDRVCLTRCWANNKKQQQPQLPPSTTTTATEPVLMAQGSKVAPLSDEDIIPRLTRCYAVRRDCSFFRNWSVSEVEAATLVGQWRCYRHLMEARGLSVIFLHQFWFGFVVRASSLSQKPSCHWYVVVSLVLARYSLFPDPFKETAYSSHFA